MFYQNRPDLSNWIIHFVHDRDPSLQPQDYSNELSTPTLSANSYDYQGNDIDKVYGVCDDEFPLQPDADAFFVLQKILHCGFIRAGFAFRKTKRGLIVPTIYGPKPAVCFTEMPFGSYLEYVKARNKNDIVSPYAFAIHRSDLFAVGARPVIYGLSGRHQENTNGNIFYEKGLRTLHTDCGISLREQYRYVYTNLSGLSPIDWTHEREWRWADTDDRYETPGLPFLLQSLCHTFKGMFILVQFEDEAEEIQSLLQYYYHKKVNYANDAYNLQTLANLRVTSLELLKKEAIDLQQAKFEDFARPAISKSIPQHQPSSEIIELVKSEMDQAITMIEEFEQKIKGQVIIGGKKRVDYPYFVGIVTEETLTPITQTMIDLGYLQTWEGEGYIICTEPLTYKNKPNSRFIEDTFVKIAAYLTERLGQMFYCVTT
ncbi:hypothetical protein [Chitinophaga filiformis]|uniref:Uncharacterized protein n=1 Tax=Chitinophaga filiformis TaxID=104663 RepID=A0ABY4HYS0_CHIFI|nr:hypothetical protein [Chitinophaga filiformis]UPK68078.1 hypothetical protein MYF79_24300 [Chitinophaga filiformis]